MADAERGAERAARERELLFDLALVEAVHGKDVVLRFVLRGDLAVGYGGEMQAGGDPEGRSDGNEAELLKLTHPLSPCSGPRSPEGTVEWHPLLALIGRPRPSGRTVFLHA